MVFHGGLRTPKVKLLKNYKDYNKDDEFDVLREEAEDYQILVPNDKTTKIDKVPKDCCELLL